MTVTCKVYEIDLSKKERELLGLFITNQRRVVLRERILNTVWVWGMSSDTQRRRRLCRACEQARNKDPVSGVIGFQKGV